MKSKNKFNRQTIDFLLTELLPYEKGNHFTHLFLYEYLQKNKNTLNKIVKKIKERRDRDTFFDSTWHSSPLKFKVSKTNEGFRELSLINLLGLIESLAFINIFEDDLINISHNKVDFSTRKARRINSLTYKKNKNQTVFYTNDPDSKKQLLLALESKGTYFKHYPFKSMTELLNSNMFIYSRDKYNLLLTIDIQNCFSSIYTHSYKWLISNKTYDSKNLNNSNSIYTNIDTFLQNLNGSKTNGIVIGPELSRFLAEFLLIHIDQQLIEQLAEENTIKELDYKIFRFVDDYFVLSNNKNTLNIIKDELEFILNKYQLKINTSKVNIYDTEDNLNEWILGLPSIMNLIDKAFIYIKKPFKEYYQLFEQNEEIKVGYLEAATTIEKLNTVNNFEQRKKIRYVDIRNNINDLIKKTNENSFICSYILSVILKKIEEDKDDNLYINMGLNDLVRLVFFLYSKKVSYVSTQKVIRIFTLLFKAEENIKHSIEDCIENFKNNIFNNYTGDWIDLLLFISSYKIDISNSLLKQITNKILSEENPVHIASVCLFYETNYIELSNFVRNLNQIVKRKLEQLNWEDFFQDEFSWWVFIFYSYPKLSKNNKNFIKKKICEVKDKLECKSSNCEVKDKSECTSSNCKAKDKLEYTPSELAKCLILDYLLESKNHFIEWSFTKESYHKKFYFYTKDRTVFNPDIIDPINISR
ncbi:RNA-directed DNA polymerase [Bacillus inaquosorum]|uniref:RNA-directed DNA polymerase n=1 Tax=Bacillus inaquosorum TaxID=483913 RepID=UPI002E1B80E8|nr:RNA-directed DNA polymerase [Bacillus inaquosorum]